MKKSFALLTGTLLVTLLSCSGKSPRLSISRVGPQSASVSPGQWISFGSGPIEVKEGSVEFTDYSWSPPFVSIDSPKVPPVVFVTPAENSGQEPGIILDETRHFAFMHPVRGHVIRPGERWFLVFTVIARGPDNAPMGDVQLTYRSGKSVRRLQVPTNMTLEIKK